jgi:hypothetical protein
MSLDLFGICRYRKAAFSKIFILVLKMVFKTNPVFVKSFYVCLVIGELSLLLTYG